MRRFTTRFGTSFKRFYEKKPVRIGCGEKGTRCVPSSQEESFALAAGAVVVGAVVRAAAVVVTATGVGAGDGVVVIAAAEEDQNDDENDPDVGAIVIAHFRFTSLVMLYNILCVRLQFGT